LCWHRQTATATSAPHNDRRRRLPIAAAFFGLGLIFGFVSVRLGPLGLIEALIVLGLILVQVRRFPERSGAYLVGMSLLPLIILASIVARMPSCPATDVLSAAPQCYAPITVPAMVGYALAGLAGALLTGAALRRLFRPSTPPA
jgi:hypothetical protein